MSANSSDEMQICQKDYESRFQLSSQAIQLHEGTPKSKIAALQALESYYNFRRIEQSQMRYYGEDTIPGIFYANDEGLYFTVDLNEVDKKRGIILKDLSDFYKLSNINNTILSIEKLANYLLETKFTLTTVAEDDYAFFMPFCELTFVSINNQKVIYMVKCFNLTIEGNLKRIFKEKYVNALLKIESQEYLTKEDNSYQLSCYRLTHSSDPSDISQLNYNHSSFILDGHDNINDSCLTVAMCQSISNSQCLDISEIINEVCQIGINLDIQQENFISRSCHSKNHSIICDAPSGTGKSLCTGLTALIRLKLGLSTVITSPTDSGCLATAMEIKKLGEDFLSDDKNCGKIIFLTTISFDINDEFSSDKPFTVEYYMENQNCHKLWKDVHLDPTKKKTLYDAFKSVKQIRTLLNGKLNNLTISDINYIYKFEYYKNILEGYLINTMKPKIIIMNTDLLLKRNIIHDYINNNSLIMINEVEQIERWRIMILTMFYNKCSFMFIGNSKYAKPSEPFGRNNDLYKFFFHQNIFFKNCSHITLETNHRYNKNLCNFISKVLYDDKLKNINSDCGEMYHDQGFVFVHKNNHHVSSKTNLITNTFEVEQTKFLIDYLNIKNMVDMKDIAVLCFYSGQQQLMRKLLPPNVNVMTVENSFGLEFPYTIICTSSHENNEIIHDKYRILVSLTRAKKGMFLIIHENIIDDFMKIIVTNLNSSS
ncbi:P-loop containing nucleoside triphosphate hydrolase domain-containing protein [Strongyloides ratti]|uniref:P-loop containing Nucleoside triphosphate hydrolase domain-containing protein n=1 Tax=Strongyloides ratti TaxID=34506 RepID=A0A090LJV5_STRRB|nr:P-loop containing nucleoside triphosphate hydrolase domain-containing protein [Strongyloides ratti]CEF70087.1 P-loop containing nucleoside triphosphate hydrolase domain-containing protein [Strongyloides ratti]